RGGRDDPWSRPVRGRETAPRPGPGAPGGDALDGGLAGRPPQRRRAGVARFHARRVAAYRSDGGVLLFRDLLLGCLRTGGVDAQPVRRPLHAAIARGDPVPVELVCRGPGDLRDTARARVRVAVGAVGSARAVEPGQVRVRAVLHRTLVRAARAGGAFRAGSWAAGESLVAHRVLLRPGAGRAEPLAGGP